MGQWKPIADVIRYSKEEEKTSFSWLRTLPKTHFLFDESIEDNVIRSVRAAGFRADAVAELGLKGRQDTELFALAWKRKQMLVTYDQDFWDDQSFPLSRCAGLLQVPNIGRNLDLFWSMVMGPMRIFARGRDLWFHTKIRVNAQRQITNKCWDRDIGSIVTTRYWMKKDGSVLMWD